jgi:hypothetical protein
MGQEKITSYQRECLINFVGRVCEECHKNEAQVGRLEIHRVHQGGEYSLRNVKVCCSKCHGRFSAAQRMASRSQS